MSDGAWTWGSLRFGVVHASGSFEYPVGIDSGKRSVTVQELLCGGHVTQLAPGRTAAQGTLECYMNAQGRSAIEAAIDAGTPNTVHAPDGEDWPNMLLISASGWRGIIGYSGDRLVRLEFIEASS
jgi:hypothetical protein